MYLRGSPRSYILVSFTPVISVLVTSSITSSVSTVQTAPAPTTSSPAAPVSSEVPNTGLPIPAKAGIGVGVAIAALLIAGALFFFLRRRKRAHQSSSSPRRTVHEKGLDNAESKPELTGSMPARSGSYTAYNKPELSARKNTITESTSASSWVNSSSAEPETLNSPILHSKCLVLRFLQVQN